MLSQCSTTSTARKGRVLRQLSNTLHFCWRIERSRAAPKGLKTLTQQMVRGNYQDKDTIANGSEDRRPSSKRGETRGSSHRRRTGTYRRRKFPLRPALLVHNLHGSFDGNHNLTAILCAKYPSFDLSKSWETAWSEGPHAFGQARDRYQRHCWYIQRIQSSMERMCNKDGTVPTAIAKASKHAYP